MLSLPGSNRIFLYVPPTDMRKSFKGLSTIVYAHQGAPEDGSYFVFVNKRCTHVKIMFWDDDGLAIWYKRLTRGRFAMPPATGEKIRLNRQGLTLLLEGVVALKKKKRFSLEKKW